MRALYNIGITHPYNVRSAQAFSLRA